MHIYIYIYTSEVVCVCSSLDLPRAQKTIPIALALRACEAACARSLRRGWGWPNLKNPGVRCTVQALGSRVGPASGWLAWLSWLACLAGLAWLAWLA